MQISRQTRGAFADLCSSRVSLRQIRDAFGWQDFEPVSDYEGDEQGQRRQLVGAFYAGINWDDEEALQRVLQVYLSVIDRLRAEDGSDSDRHLRALVASLSRDGVRLTEEAGGIAALHFVESVEDTVETMTEGAADRRKVFVVYGRNEAARIALFEFLRSIDLTPLEWSQLRRATGHPAPYIGDVLSKGFEIAQACVVLLTPDDEARLRPDFVTADDGEYERALTAQVRPNVLFEAGMAMGLKPDRTIFVELGRLRPLSDLAGRHNVRMSDSQAMRQELASRLADAGCAVDTSGHDWHTAGRFLASIQNDDRVEIVEGPPIDSNAERERTEARARGDEAPQEEEVTEERVQDEGSDEDDLGFLDLAILGQEAQGRMIATTERIGRATEAIGNRMVEQKGAMDAFSENPDPVGAQALVNSVARELDAYASTLEECLPELEAGVDALIRQQSKYVAYVCVQADEEAVADLRNELDSLLQSVADRSGLEGFKVAISGLQNVTRDLTRASRRVISVIDIILGVMSVLERFCVESLATLDSLGDDGPSDS